MENKENEHSWLFGLEKFFQFRGEQLKHEFIRCIIHLRYYKQEDRPWALKRIFALDAANFPDEERDTRWNVYTEMMVRQSVTVKTVFWLMDNIWANDKFINDLYLFFNNTDTTIANDLFSKSQVLSKIWMAETLRKFIVRPTTILLIGGWYGQHRWYLKDINVKSVTNIDLDGRATFVSKAIADTVNEPYEVIEGDINNLLSEQGTININGENLTFDLVINTSAEHMDVSWFHRLPENQTILVQSNDMFDIDGHINCVGSLEEMSIKYPFKQLNSSGQLKLSHGNRYMLYGVK